MEPQFRAECVICIPGRACFPFASCIAEANRNQEFGKNGQISAKFGHLIKMTVPNTEGHRWTYLVKFYPK